MDLRLTFNTDPHNYDKLRPTYKKEMFDDLFEYSNLNQEDKGLEIGIGTGQATLPFLEAGIDITAVELGPDLAEFSRKKFKDYSNLHIINDNFEDVELELNKYNIAYSATAFHWIPIDLGMRKIKDILVNKGTFAWFSNHPAPCLDQVDLHNDIQKVYTKYDNYFGTGTLDIWSIDQMNQDKLLDRKKKFEDYGFVDVVEKSYKSQRIFNSKDYCKLLATYSGHIALPNKVRRDFLKDIEDVILFHGNEIIISDTILMVMGKK